MLPHLSVVICSTWTGIPMLSLMMSRSCLPCMSNIRHKMTSITGRGSLSWKSRLTSQNLIWWARTKVNMAGKRQVLIMSIWMILGLSLRVLQYSTLSLKSRLLLGRSGCRQWPWLWKPFSSSWSLTFWLISYSITFLEDLSLPSSALSLWLASFLKS